MERLRAEICCGYGLALDSRDRLSRRRNSQSDGIERSGLDPRGRFPGGSGRGHHGSCSGWDHAWTRRTLGANAGINRVSLGVQSFRAAGAGAHRAQAHSPKIVEREMASAPRGRHFEFQHRLDRGTAGSDSRKRGPSRWIGSSGSSRRMSPFTCSKWTEDSRLGIGDAGAWKALRRSRSPVATMPIADFYEIAVERLAGLGIERYEISNFARPGFESRHNLKYWRREPYSRLRRGRAFL